MPYQLQEQGLYRLATQGELISEIEEATGIFAYSLALDDPTTELMIVWVDEEGSGEQHSLEYGTDSFSSSVTNISPWRSLDNGNFIYRAEISELTPGTVYNLRVQAGRGQKTLTPAKTLPSELPESGVTILMTHDTHVVKRQVTNPSQFAAIADRQYDLVIGAGDWIGELDQERNATNAGIWSTAMRDYFGQLNKDFMPPLLYVPGNHDVGNSSNDGTSTGDQTGTLFRDFFPNCFEVTPAGTNHIAVACGDYFQALSADVYSALANEVGPFLQANHDETVQVACYIAHSPMFSAPDMRTQPNDGDLQQRLRNEAFRFCHDADNIHFTSGGNIHVHTRTKVLTYVTEEPSGDSFTVQADADSLGGPTEAWIVESQDGLGLVEFGQGYIQGRTGSTDNWFFELETNEEGPAFRQFDVITVKPDGTTEVETINEQNNQLDFQTFPLTGQDVTRTGTVTRNGSAVEGADVVFITRSDLLANATAQTSTDASGAYSADIPTGEEMVGIALEGADGDSTPFTEGS